MSGSAMYSLFLSFPYASLYVMYGVREIVDLTFASGRPFRLLFLLLSLFRSRACSIRCIGRAADFGDTDE